MKIGFDAKRAFFNRSGLGNYSRSAIHLTSAYYPANTYVLYAASKNRIPFSLASNQSIEEPGNKFFKTFSSLWRSWGIKAQIKKQELDIFHGLSNELPFRINKTGVRAVVTIHDLIFLRFPEYYSFIDRQIYTWKFRYACRVADWIIATSEATKKDIISHFGTNPNKITVVYQTCNPVFKVRVDSGMKTLVKQKHALPDQYILYLGTIEKRKNALTLIKAYAKAKIDIPLIIAGKPTSYLKEIDAFIADNPGKKDKILFRHSIPSEDLPAIYQSATLFAYPSVFEGFGIPILEAMYSGVPVLTSTGSCFAETGGDAAYYCDPYDIDKMALALTTILNDKSLRESMIQKGYTYSKVFDEQNVAANLMNVYQNMV